ncbi:hypothetical protein ACFYMO_06370 [Streptomyces sp. NPDC007025]|uniref:hypothetical protein n=1 Tax=Streptomyces sp. NPDC007025 TaxID=3364771 RepID=UPI0036935B78
MLTTADFPVLTTVLDLSALYPTRGLARREETSAGTRWPVPSVLPLAPTGQGPGRSRDGSRSGA